MVSLTKRFSLPHFDNFSHPSLYYEAIRNSTQQFKDEIFDIYFGKVFRFTYQDQEVYDASRKTHEVVYGNVMGVEASDKQVDNLFRIHNDFGIEISLTINQLSIPIEIFFSRNNKAFFAFLDWVQVFYDRGLRSCTLASNHIMRTGILQKRFPEMKWKNTVNQQVSTAQQVLDYLYLGYDIIQLDRSLNRNLDELRRIKEVVENYKAKYPGRNVKTSLLVWEDCMPSCPFKREHDDLQIYFKVIKYWDSHLGLMTCRRWRSRLGKSVFPRSGTNCFWASTETFEEYAALVDVFKHSGRLAHYLPKQEAESIQFGWVLKNYPTKLPRSYTISSFSEIVNNKLEPIHLWYPIPSDISDFRDPKRVSDEIKYNIFSTNIVRQLEQRLKNCRNQCYTCHLCERVLGIPDIDSMLEV